MPAYPFLVLSVLSNVETLNRPLNRQVTSYGYCYEALIIIAFTKSGFKTDDEIGGAINFLSAFAHKLHKYETYELSDNEFNEFVIEYEKHISLPFKIDEFIRKLLNTRLLVKTTLGNYRFDYKYIYYYFMAKFLSEQESDPLNEIEKLCTNIHKDENAYIVIFFAHNSKSKKLYELLRNEADTIYKSVEPITLTKDEMSFFDDSYQSLISIVLPSKAHNYKIEREKMLAEKKEQEYSSLSKLTDDDYENEYLLNLRKSVKLTEAIGIVVKNRFTSIEKKDVKDLLTSAILLNFRGLNHFFHILKEPDNQREIIDFIADIIQREIDKEKDVDDSKCRKIARSVFWSINFFYVLSIVFKTTESIGSEKLVSFIKDIADENPSPANQLILEGVKIIYSKNIDKNVVFKHIGNKNYSSIAKTILKIFISEYCRMNPTDFSERQQLSDKMNIPIEKLKSASVKRNNS